MARHTVNFSNVEQDDSPIQWERADPATAEKLRAAIDRYRNRDSLVKVNFRVPPVAEFVLPAVILLAILIFAFSMARDSDSPLQIIVPTAVAAAVMVIFFLVRFLKYKDSYLEKPGDVWIFRAKCMVPMRDNRVLESYYPVYFHKNGVNICIHVTAWEYKMHVEGKKLLTGQEFIFYKFNEKTGNPWKAVPAEYMNGDQPAV